MKKGNALKLLGLLLVLVIVLVLVFTLKATQENGYKGDFYDKENTTMEKVVKLGLGYQEMETILGEKSIYPEYYQAVKLREINGLEEEEAMKEAKYALIEEMALYNTALLSAEIQVSKDDLNMRVEQLRKEIKKRDNFQELENVCKEEGTSFEEYYKNNGRFNRVEATMNQFWYFWKAASSSPITDEMIQAKKKESVDEFKQTKQYDEMVEGLSFCEKALKELGSNAEGVKEKYGEKLLVDSIKA